MSSWPDAMAELVRQLNTVNVHEGSTVQQARPGDWWCWELAQWRWSRRRRQSFCVEDLWKTSKTTLTVAPCGTSSPSGGGAKTSPPEPWSAAADASSAASTATGGGSSNSAVSYRRDARRKGTGSNRDVPVPSSKSSLGSVSILQLRRGRSKRRVSHVEAPDCV